MSIMLNQEKINKDLDTLKLLAKVAASSKQYGQLNEIQLLNLMMSARDLGISPMKAINGGFYVVNGKVCMSTALMADRIRREGHSIKIIEMTREKCVINASRRDNNDSLKIEYTLEDAKLANLTESPTWKRYPKNMLYNRCMSQVARILFPDVVGNSYSEEERYDIQNVSPDQRPLEDADKDIPLESVSLELEISSLTKEQREELGELVSKLEEKDLEKLEELLGCVSIYDIHPKDFNRVTRSIRTKISGGFNGQ